MNGFSDGKSKASQMLTPDEAEELAFLVGKLEADNARATLQGFARAVMPTWQGGKHLDALCAKLEAVERGECKRLIVTVPPRHGKSQTASILFPAWCLGRDPRRKFVVASYGADLAKKHGRECNRIVAGESFRALFPACSLGGDLVDTQDEWETPGGGGYKCVGVGGALTGHGGDYLLVDDALKNRADANSPTIRAGVTDWYRSTLRTRLAPGGAIIIIATRWHPADLSGILLNDKEGEKWDVLHFPAIDHEGKALWPERWPLEELAKTRASVGRHEWASLYQGEPTVRGGNIFQVDRIREENPDKWEGLRFTRAWDMASSVKQRSGDDPDWTVGVLAAIRKEKDASTGAMIPHLYVRDVIFLREESPRRNARIKQAAEQDGQGVQIVVEAFGAYKDAANELTQALAGQRSIRQIRPPGDKMSKAAPLEPIFEAGNVHVPAGAPWLAQWLQHFEEFPQGAHDDACDATALIWHAQTGGSGAWL